MAKGARSSVRKNNNKKLRAKVFGPVEDARAERLSAKLLELAAQPNPPRPDMEVEPSSGEFSSATTTLDSNALLLTCQPADSKQAESEAKETPNANGALSCLSIPIPLSLARNSAANPAAASATMLTPPPTPPLEPSEFSKPSVRKAHTRFADEQLFFHLLGVSTNIQGFDALGNICLGFGSETEESDAESSGSSGAE